MPQKGKYIMAERTLNKRTLVWAHRGVAYAPENTLPSFQMAVDMKADGVELDVHLTKDKKILVCHNGTVEGTSDGPICLGLIPSFLYFALALWSTYRAASRGKWEIAAVAIAAGLYCTMEYSLINPVLCTVFAACARLDDGKSETQNV